MSEYKDLARCDDSKRVEYNNIGKGEPMMFSGTTTRNISEMKHDEFICEKCRIRIVDWVRLKADEDDECLCPCEYEFSYCPSCGRRVIV